MSVHHYKQALFTYGGVLSKAIHHSITALFISDLVFQFWALLNVNPGLRFRLHSRFLSAHKKQEYILLDFCFFTHIRVLIS